MVTIASRPDAAHVVRLGGTTFYQRAQRKLGVTSSAELDLPDTIRR
jgi:NAD+ kinase